MTAQKFTIHTKLNNEDIILHPKTEVSQVEGFTQSVNGLIDTAVAGKADASSVYTKTETDAKLNEKANTTNVYTKTDVDTKLDAKANNNSVYTKTETDTKLDAKANAADVYTKTEVDNAISNKADSSSVYTKTEVNNALSDKADASNVYTKAEVDSALTGKADTATTLNGYGIADAYTKTEIDTTLESIVSNGTVNRATADGLGNNIAETYATKAELSAIPQFDIQVVNALPTANISDTTVYLVLSNSGATANLYTEYIYVNDKWEKLGEHTTEVDLSDYMPKSGGTFTGNVMAPTPEAADNSTKVATTAYVNTKLDGYSTTSHTHNYAGSSSAGGAATSALVLAGNPSSRQTSANVTYGDNGVRHYVASASMTTGKPPSDASILHIAWDNTGKYDGQIAISTSDSKLYYRSQGGSNAWNAWKTALATNEITTGTANGTISVAGTDVAVKGLASGAYAAAYVHPSYTARTGKPTANATPAFGGTFTVSQITSDATGHVTAATDRTITIPSTVFGAASSSAAGSVGLVKAPAKGDQDKFLRGNATWATASDIINTLSEGTSAAQAADYVVCQYAGGGTTTTTYHRRPVSKVLDALTKAQVTTALGYTPPTTNTTYSNMTAATADAAGKAGLVPAPGKGKQTSFLRGDGTWVVPTNTTNSAGANNSTAKLFLVGTTAQSTGTSYSNANVYATNGALHASSISTGGNVVVGGTANTNYLQLPSGIKLY